MMTDNKITRPSIMEVNIHNFKYNIEQIKGKVKTDTTIMPIIKANAYGTYLNTRLDVINEFDIVGVATVDEGVELRKLGYKKDIFILNQPYKDEINKIIVNDLIIGVSSDNFIKELGQYNEKVRIHIEIGTGMGRTGIHPKRIEEYLEKIKQYQNIIIDGIYTHLSSADIDLEYTEKQLNSFDYAINIAKKYVNTIRYIHAQASTGILNLNEKEYNLVRPGIIIYGYYPDDSFREKIDLKPVAKLKSKITLLKNVKEGTSISYGRSFIAKRESKIATIPIGYADGIRRMLSNKGYVVIRGEKVPIVGKICMDGFMVDVTDLAEVEIGDDVWIWDNEIISLDEIAHSMDTINYEIISTISSRIPRKFNK